MDTNLNAPLVSVIMPVYNCGNFVAEAVESILNQTLTDLELIIIDDCSTDNTRDILERYQDRRIRLLKKEANSGYIDSLNTGIAISLGKFLARMDGDDISVPFRLEKQVQFLNNNPDVVLCGAWYQLLGSEEIIRLPVEDGAIKIALLDYCALGHPTVMFRKSFIEANHLSYDAGFRPAEDYELWTRTAAIGKIANLPEVLLHYRSHPGQVSIHEKGNQLSNSLRCRMRMLCYPLTETGDADLKMSELVAENEKISDPELLIQIIDWLTKLNTANASGYFYDRARFSAYIDNKKAGFIRSFYLNTTAYNPGVLLRYLRAKGRFSAYFSITEQMKLALKCLFFWKPRVTS